jgi:hypothetical protein
VRARGALAARLAGVAVLAVALTPMLTLCAAMSARREGRLPVGVLATAIAVDPSGGAGAVVAWLAFWPALATNLGAVSLILVTSAGSGRGCRNVDRLGERGVRGRCGVAASPRPRLSP